MLAVCGMSISLESLTGFDAVATCHFSLLSQCICSAIFSFLSISCGMDKVTGVMMNTVVCLQTGSGKTYTMGTGFDVNVDRDFVGIIPRAVEHLFQGIEDRRKEASNAGRPPPEFSIKAQFIEV